MRQYAEENRIKKVRIPAPRGMIFDRFNRLLVDNRPAFDVSITPQYFKESKEPARILGKMSEILKLPVVEIQKRLVDGLIYS
jgi:penicillin-binding protein 2